MIHLATLALAASAAASPAPRAYTNEDLDRVRPFAAETGVQSVPAVRETGPATESDRRSVDRGPVARGEDYWRREKERAAAKIEPLERAMEETRGRIAERERQKGVRPVSDPQLVALRERLARLQERARAIERDLEERARRAGALPGWLR